MDTRKNKQLVESFWQEFSQGNYQNALDMIASDATWWVAGKTLLSGEYTKEEFTDLKKIEERIKNRVDIFDRNYKYEKVDLDSTFPKYILNNLDKYQDWII